MSRSTRLLSFALGGCLAVLLLASPVLGQATSEPQQGPAEDLGSTAEPNNEPPKEPTPEPEVAPADNAPAVTDLAGGDHDEESEHGKDQQPDEDIRPSWPPRTFWFDTAAQWLMALFGVIATGISIWAVMLLRDNLRETRKATEAALGMVNAERAWMAYDGFNSPLLNNATDGDEIHELTVGIELKWINCGRSPAIDARVHTTHEIVDEDIVPEFPRVRSSRGTHIGPNIMMTAGMQVITAAQYQDLLAHRNHLFIHSYTEYNVIGDPEVKHSEVCGEVHYVGMYNDGHPRGERPHFILSPKGPQNTVT